MTKMNVFFYQDPLHSTDGAESSDAVPAATLTSPISNVQVAGLFSYFGGNIQWEVKPDIAANKTAFDLKINLPVVYDSPPVPGSEVEHELASVTFEVNSAWHPSDAVMEQYYKDMQDEKLRLTRELSPRLIYDLHAIAESDYPNIILQRALAEELDFPNGFDVMRVKDMSAPFWAEPSAAETYRYLAARLKSLPINLEMHRVLTDCLVASRAIVYLPVNEGQEEAALNLLKEARAHAAEIAGNFARFRDGRYGPLPGLTVPTVDVLTGPAPTLATTAESTAWLNDWEKPQRAFEVLGQWSEIIALFPPTALPVVIGFAIQGLAGLVDFFAFMADAEADGMISEEEAEEAWWQLAGILPFFLVGLVLLARAALQIGVALFEMLVAALEALPELLDDWRAALDEGWQNFGDMEGGSEIFIPSYAINDLRRLAR